MIGRQAASSKRRRVAAALVALILTATPATPAVSQEVEEPTAPGPPAAATVAACRPAEPAVAPTPGRSVTVDRGPAECSTVALTFDAGADRGYAELILDILRENGVPASFGMTGQWAEKNGDLVQRMADEGHALINHTWTHRSFTGFSPKTRALGPGERRVELDRTEELLRGLSGRTTRPYFRPPYGDLDGGALADVADAGYDYTIMWTVDSLGWNHLSTRAIVERCLSRAAPGTIYLFHVGADSADALALGQIIEGLRARGLGFVTIPDLLGL
jgi:peptidoglycan/xylan/chitin deacetylase (PgdA/CDA1 family)